MEALPTFVRGKAKPFIDIMVTKKIKHHFINYGFDMMNQIKNLPKKRRL